MLLMNWRLPSIPLRTPLVAALVLVGLCGCTESTEPTTAPAAPVDNDAAKPVSAAPRQWRGRPLLPQAKPEIHEEFLRDRTAAYGPGDGEGRAKLVEGGAVSAGHRGRWVFEYTVGVNGIQQGGSVGFQVSPFWGWSDPQVQDPEFVGFTETSCSNADVELLASATFGQGLLKLTVTEGMLQSDDTITITYGAGPAQATADRYAEGREFFYFWVDGDGDGRRKLIAEDVEVAIRPGTAADLLITVPSRVALGDSFPINLAFVDRAANRATDFVGTVQITATPGLELPTAVEFTAEHEGQRKLEGLAATEGIYQIEVQVRDGSRQSNPMLVEDSPLRLFWGDLHGHSTHSDGSATPTEYYRYARDVAALDVVALTDHDHFGMRKLDEDPELWEHIQSVTEEFHDPGTFVTLQGYEWTNWLWGHRHVLFFHDSGEIYSCLDQATESPEGLWQALQGQDAITVAHHPAGGPVPVDWSFPPPPELEPVVEIVSVHGNSESARSPAGIRNPSAGSYVRDALARGYKLGLIGSGDSHDGHPGLAHRGGPTGGVAAFYTDSLTRAGILQALRRRSVYATSGPRIILQFRLGTTPMGQTHSLDPEQPPTVLFRVIGTTQLETVDLIKNTDLYFRAEIQSASSVAHTIPELDLATGDFIYLRVIQKDGSMAWSSPIWIE